MPALSSWSSGMVPQPISVGMTGTPVSSANSTSSSAASALMMPPPATMSGTLAGGEHVEGLLDLGARRGRLVGRQRGVGLDVELDLGHLDVDRQVDEDRTRATRAHQVEGLLEGARHLGRLEDGDRHLGERLGDRGDVDGLEVLLVQLGHGRLAGDAQDRDRVGAGRVEPGDHVGAGRAAGADADADVAGLGAGVALGHVGGALDVAGERVVQAAVGLHRLVEGVDRGSGQPEDVGDPLLLQDLDGCLGRCHACHGGAPGLESRRGMPGWLAESAGGLRVSW